MPMVEQDKTTPPCKHCWRVCGGFRQQPSLAATAGARLWRRRRRRGGGGGGEEELWRRGVVGRSQAAPVVSCSNPDSLTPNNPAAPEVSSPTEDHCQTRAAPPHSNHGKLSEIGRMQTPYWEECVPIPCEVCTNNPHGLKIRNLSDTQAPKISKPRCMNHSCQANRVQDDCC